MTDKVFDPWAEEYKDSNGLYKTKWLQACLEEDVGLVHTKEIQEELLGFYVGDKAEWARMKQILRKFSQLTDVEKSLRRACGGLEPRNRETPIIAVHGELVAEVFPDIDLPPGLEVPVGWEYKDHTSGPCLFKVKAEGELAVSYDPLFIASLLIGVSTGETFVELMWRVRNRDRIHWMRRVVPRLSIKDPRALISALSASDGFPGDAANSKHLVSYLTDFEAHNAKALPRRMSSPQMGWINGGEMGFLAGGKHMGPGEKVEFVGAGIGESQMLRAVSEVGTMDEWKKGAKIVSKYPLVEFAIYAACAAPLLEVLSTPNFCVDWSYKSGAGKTTALSVAASCWGQPDPNGMDSYLSSWDATQVGLERRAGAMSSLPLILDDTKTAKSWGGKSAVPGIIYRVVEGSGKLRGARVGIDETSHWRTVLLASGEQRLTDFSKDGGVGGRVLSLWGCPFGDCTDAISKDIQDIKTALFANYGHAGPALAQWLLDQRGNWEEIRRAHVESATRILARLRASNADSAMDGGTPDRLSKSLATIEIAAECLHHAVEMPWKLGDMVGSVIELVAEGSCAVDREVEALKYAVSWAISNRKKFITSEAHRRNKDEPHGGWLGFWEAEINDDWQTLSFFPGQLNQFLTNKGFEYKAVSRRWLEEGWVVSAEGRSTSRCNDLDGRPRMVQISRASAERYGDLGG